MTVDWPDPPERPAGVPNGAQWFPPADDFSALEAFNVARPGGMRSYLRVAVPFFIWTFSGVMLHGVHHRALSVKRRTWSMGRCLIWSDETKPVPGVWAWTLADERDAS